MTVDPESHDSMPPVAKRSRRRASRIGEHLHRNAMPKPMLSILDEHAYIARLLRILEVETARLGTREQSDLECIESILHYITHYPDIYHHPKEDLIFCRMADIDDSHVETADRLRLDHAQHASESRSLLHRVEALRQSRSRTKEGALKSPLISYVKSLRTHMQYEEQEVFGPAIAHLSAEDWQAIDDQIKPIVDPVFGEKKSDRYRDLFGKFLNQYDIFSTGNVYSTVFEKIAGSLEQATYTVGELRTVPSRLFAVQKKVLRDQLHDLQRLTSAKTNADRISIFTDLVAEKVRIGGGYYKDLFQVFRTGEENTAKQPSADTDTSRTPAPGDEFLTFQETPYRHNPLSGVSWQAATFNLFLRLTVKQLMAHISLDDAVKLKRLVAKWDKLPRNIGITDVDSDDFTAQWVQPKGIRPGNRTILHLPGGAFFMPAVSGHLRMLGRLARLTNARCMMVRYRLAPEHPFPAGLEDAVAAYRYLLEQGTSPAEIVLLGDSAGGGLVLSLLLSLRDQGLPMPAAACTISALADLSFSTPSRAYNRWLDPMLPTDRRMQGFEVYTGDTPKDEPLVSPVYGNFQGFPPMLAQVCSTEILLDDTLRVARKARSQGVEFKVEIWENLFHDFQVLSFIPEARQALAQIAAFFREHLPPPAHAAGK